MNKATQITECSAEETGIYGDTEEEDQCLNASKLTLHESASLLGISPINSFGKRDSRIWSAKSQTFQRKYQKLGSNNIWF